ncbi:hypothetical protein DICPUDRAFT_152890 [Dictyostelium purpureum]|uniref:Uncharacterized protein n=1 Tax=Dictyostelium purpureum TaxID=5786 RepID=F0ZMJ2_DICPU|nr:uncharacterized protein DICPUDRAFT_152890 [Dictyostelium purpureum]EGC34834.1 hypothetical protein DICPUDRAFT_152890 [Dictyostelium purpureum]|eukprot:XP_003288641.1 hypothetical protein DICPUDRAFT_152890 [Dictyostelium purpureum]
MNDKSSSIVWDTFLKFKINVKGVESQYALCSKCPQFDIPSKEFESKVDFKSWLKNKHFKSVVSVYLL